MSAAFHNFHRKIINPAEFRLFMLAKLPAAFFAGLRIISFDEQCAAVGIRYKWFNRNPFGSMYFAVQSMAAEMSTGLLASGHVYQRNPSVSMLVTAMEAKFIKRVTGKAIFTCEDGTLIRDAIEETIRTNEAKTVRCSSVGTNEAGEIVSEFIISWSFKARR